MSSLLAPLSRVYEWAREQGFGLHAEHLLTEGVPVQLLPAYNALVEGALLSARVHDYGGVPVRVVDPSTWSPWPCRPAARGGASGPGNSWRRARWIGSGCDRS